MTEIWVPLFGGLVLLVLGGDILVRSAIRVAEGFGISPLVIGLTLVGFGTSMPELVTSVQASLSGAPGIAFGNIVGSNNANILLIAGISALMCPILVTGAALRRDAAVMLTTALGFALIAMFLPMARLIGLLLLGCLTTYLVLVLRQERRRATQETLPETPEAATHLPPASALTSKPKLMPFLAALSGLVMVVVGGSLLVSGAVALAQGFGVSETLIGLTIVAVGTSLPELVTSVIASLRRQGDVAFGNVVGSNIYNILGIGGATALIAPSRIPDDIVTFDAPVMVLVTFVFILFAASGMRIARREGAVLLLGYAAYLWMLLPS